MFDDFKGENWLCKDTQKNLKWGLRNRRSIHQ